MSRDDEWTREKVEQYAAKRGEVSRWMYTPLARKISKYIDEHRHGEPTTIVDLGCGPGFLSFEIKKMKPELRIIGIDPSEHMLEIAKTKAKQHGIQDFDVMKGQAEDIPLPNEAADVVISQHNLHLWDSLESGLREIYRVLKKGGTFIVKDPDKDCPKWKYRLFFFSMVLTSGLRSARNRSRRHEKWRSLREVKGLLELENFQIEVIEGGMEYTIVARKRA